MSGIDSDFELRRALTRAFDSQAFDEPRFLRLLEAASKLESDFERSELLLSIVDRLPDSPAALEAWLATAAAVGSDFELGRVLGRALEAEVGDAAFTARILVTAGERMGSDFELRQTMERSRGRWSEPLVAAAFLDAVGSLDSSFERGQALVALLESASLEPPLLDRALVAAKAIDGSFDRLGVLRAAAPKVAGNAELSNRYRELARSMSAFERGEALSALDDVAR
jgi:hypothetical protein